MGCFVFWALELQDCKLNGQEKKRVPKFSKKKKNVSSILDHKKRGYVKLMFC